MWQRGRATRDDRGLPSPAAWAAAGGPRRARPPPARHPTRLGAADVAFVRREKVAGETNDGLRLCPVTVDAHDVDLLAGGQAEEQKGLQGARGLAPRRRPHDP